MLNLIAKAKVRFRGSVEVDELYVMEGRIIVSASNISAGNLDVEHLEDVDVVHGNMIIQQYSFLWWRLCFIR
jgi:hypothetical protein